MASSAAGPTTEDTRNMAGLLMRILSPNNEERGQAEGIYRGVCAQSPGLAACTLAMVAAYVADDAPASSSCGAAAPALFVFPVDCRQIAATLLRTSLIKDEGSLWATLSPENQDFIKNCLMRIVMCDNQRSVLRVVCDTVADLAGVLVPEGMWPQLLSQLFTCASSQYPSQRFASFAIFADLSVLLGPDMWRPVFKQVHFLLASGMGDADLKVRQQCFVATSAFFQCVTLSLDQHTELDACKALEVFIELASYSPEFFAPHLILVVDTMVEVSSVEVLLSLCEGKLPIIKKHTTFTAKILQLLLSWLMQVSESDSWEKFKEDSLCSTMDFSAQSIDRLTSALGGSAILPILLPYISSLLASQDWRQRYAAIFALALSVDGCHFVLKNYLAEIHGLLLPLLRDAHPRVRWLCIGCYGKFCREFGPAFQTKLASQFLPVVLDLVHDTSARVQANVAVTIADFISGCSKEIASIYVTQMMQTLLTLLQIPNVYVQEETVGAISTAAHSLKLGFTPFYNTFVPHLKNIMGTARSVSLRKLRAKAIESLTLIGIAVGHERFEEDAREIMNAIVQTQVVSADDPQIACFESAFGRIAECLKEKFAPYLPLVMPSALERATLKADVTVADDGEHEPGWVVYKVGVKSLAIHTSVLEEKLSAIRLILIYAAQLGSSFLPYLKDVVRVVILAMQSEFHEGIRVEACQGAPVLIKFALEMEKSGGISTGSTVALWHELFIGLISAIATEKDHEVLVGQLNAIDTSMEAIGRPCLNEEDVNQFETIGLELLAAWQARREEREETAGTCECEEDKNQLQEDEFKEEDILTELCDCFGKIAQFHSQIYFPFFRTELLPRIDTMLARPTPDCERQYGVCFLDDVFEFCGPEADEVATRYLPIIIKFAGTDTSPGVRQASLYGIGMCGQNRHHLLAPYLEGVIKVLHQVLRNPRSRSNEQESNATDNAISAFLRIWKGLPSNTQGRNELLLMWFKNLPVLADELEAKLCYTSLCQFVTSGDPVILGQDMRNMVHIVKVFASALDSGVLTGDLPNLIGATLRHIQQHTPVTVLQAAWGALSAAERTLLQQTATL
ncbi:Karyopherin beta 3 [Pelomyxa schiedti]|nr:Karyopherin beta 3 [Pelomyxa schiedti]